MGLPHATLIMNIETAGNRIKVKRELEDVTSEAPARDEASTAPFVAMLVCNVILLLMFAA